MAVWKLLPKLYIAFWTCAAIALAAFTIGPQNILRRIFNPWVHATIAKFPIKLHEAKDIIFLNSCLSNINLNLVSGKWQMQYVTYIIKINNCIEKISIEYNINLSISESMSIYTIINLSRTSIIDIYAKADIFSCAIIVALNGTYKIDTIHDNMENW